MATNNAVNNSLTGQTGTGNFVGSLSPSITNLNTNAIYSAGDYQIVFGNAVSPVNFLQITNGATANPVSISATGTDTNVALYLSGKGSTQVRLGNDLLMYNTAGGNNYTVFSTTASGAKTVTIPNLSGTLALSGASQNVQFGQVGANGPNISTYALTAHGGTNQNLTVGPAISIANAVCLGAVNDANSANIPLEIRASGIYASAGMVAGQGDTYVKWNTTGGQFTYATEIKPTIQTFTSGSGTYTTPAGVKYIVVQMCGGGGGGSAASTGTPTVGGAGGNTTFGSSLLTANGGAAPVGGTGAVSGGLGGSFTINSPAIGRGFNGGDGGAGAYLSGTTGDNAGGSGGSNPFGGSPTGGKTNTAGNAGYANTGAGGSGGGIGATGTATAGAGGGAGGYIYAIINSPSATYSYSVGIGGTAGTGSYNGGAGAAGIIIVTEYYQ
jgi:hypothetical protein